MPLINRWMSWMFYKRKISFTKEKCLAVLSTSVSFDYSKMEKLCIPWWNYREMEKQKNKQKIPHKENYYCPNRA